MRGEGYHRLAYVKEVAPVDWLLVLIVGQVMPKGRMGNGNLEHSSGGQLQEVGNLNDHDLLVMEELHIGYSASDLPAYGQS